MSIKRVNPHHLDINSSSSLINLSFASDNKIEMSMEEIAAQMRRKMKFLSMIVGVIYNKRVANAFSNIKFKPLRTYYLKRRLVEVFLGVLRRSDYNNKYEAFLKLKKLLIKQRNDELQYLNAILVKGKASAIKIICIFERTKTRQNIEIGLKKIKQFGRQRYLIKHDRFRKGFRLWIKVGNCVMRRYFTKVRSSRYFLQRRLKIQSIGKVLRQYRIRSLKAGMQRLRRNLYRQRQSLIRSQILEIESKLQNRQDEELNSLKKKQQQLQRSLQEVKKQKQQINQAYQVQVQQAQTKNIEIQSRIKLLKQENLKITQKIQQVNQKLKDEFTLDQIFQMFYNNFLSYLSRNKNSHLIKTQMLQAITKPLIPIDLPLDQLKDENKVLKSLISEYVLMYGQKSLEGKELQIPYEYLVKENQTMYKMMVTLLPRLQYNKKDIIQLRSTLQSVQSIVKEFRT